MSTTSDPSAPARRQFFWEKKFRGATPDGRDLAALRSGLGRGAGDVPALWPYYTRLRADGYVSPELHAEHAALGLFAVHQQSQPTLMHHLGVGLGTAMSTLRISGKFSADAVDRRFAAAATATSFIEVTLHLRGLVAQLRGIRQPMDYTSLLFDLRDWQDDDKAHAVRRRWGSQYFTHRDQAEPPPDSPSA
ncbi:type I-E CRISPR-associated protein Cse2/CasB [Micromonospora sp. NPDC049903]|uniref:type I-E CRISPR-associated protein Cse2/CasB n=1 Tax=Micromonospora sp. NPDC049903 TaxID=3364276 RepID=UPI0037884735